MLIPFPDTLLKYWHFPIYLYTVTRAVTALPAYDVGDMMHIVQGIEYGRDTGGRESAVHIILVYVIFFYLSECISIYRRGTIRILSTGINYLAIALIFYHSYRMQIHI